MEGPGSWKFSASTKIISLHHQQKNLSVATKQRNIFKTARLAAAFLRSEEKTADKSKQNRGKHRYQRRGRRFFSETKRANHKPRKQPSSALP